MFNKFALVMAGLLTMSSVGCCCLGGAGYGAGYGANRCAPCNNGCSPQGGGGYYPPQTGALFQGDTSQAAYSQGGYTQSAFVPTTTALMPGAINGPPIYNTASAIPMNTLPTYSY